MNDATKDFIIQFAPWVIGLIVIFFVIRWLRKPRKKGAQYSSLPGEGGNVGKPKGRMRRYGKVKDGPTGKQTRKS